MRVAVFGSTGSIGVSTLDVLARHRARFQVTVLAAGSNHARLFEQCRQHRPQLALLEDAGAAVQL